MVSKFKTCLLVEDDPEDRDFFVQTLLAVSSRAGCYAVANGEEALTALREDGLTPDYIFTDIQMPRMNGLEFLKTIKCHDEFRDIPVIVYSSTYSDEQILKAKMLGAVAFYSKARFNVLADILRKYFGNPHSIALL